MHKTAAPWEELREKYEAGGYTYMQLAKEYGVSVQSVGAARAEGELGQRVPERETAQGGEQGLPAGNDAGADAGRKAGGRGGGKR